MPVDGSPVGSAPPIMAPARGVAGFLHVHAEIDDVGQHLHMALRLHVAAHQAERQERLAVLHHEAGNDGLERPLARRIDVRVAVGSSE